MSAKILTRTQWKMLGIPHKKKCKTVKVTVEVSKGKRTWVFNTEGKLKLKETA